MENKYKYTKAYYKILELIVSNPDETVFVIRGGQGASKTVSIIQLIMQSLVTSEKEATILSSELSKMKRTVVRDYKKIAKDWGVLQDERQYNRSENKHEYENGSYLDFLGADTNDVGKGFRRDILYINEADKMNVDAAVQFISRAGLTIIDYNPDALFWGDDYINENNFITLTFEDNEYLSQSERDSILDYKAKGFYNPDLEFERLFLEENIKNKYWANKWRVYGLGLVGALEGTVLSNWTIIDNVPPEARLLGYGMDFGYTNDPTTLIACYKYNNTYIYDQVIYRTGMLNGDIASVVRSEGCKLPIYADSANPKDIADLRKRGVNIHPTIKGEDSIRFGLGLMQQEDFYVTRRSRETIDELTKYTWARSRDGVLTGKPIDAFNHAIDAMRYFIMVFLGKPSKRTKLKVRSRR